MPKDIEQKVRGFIADNFFVSSDSEALPKDTSLIEAGIIDSTGILELVAFLEEAFQVAVKDDEIVPDNLDTVQAIVSYVDMKRRSVAA